MMNKQTYRQERADGRGALDALRMARMMSRLRDIYDRADIVAYSSPYTTWDGDAVEWTDDDGATWWIGVVDSGEPVDLEDWGNPNSWPVEDRAAHYRRQGMARGPAREHALATYRRDRDRMDQWRNVLVWVDVELVDGSNGTAGPISADVLDGTSYTNAWLEVLWVAEDLMPEAMEDARRDQWAQAMDRLPPMARRPYQVAS